MAAVDDVSAVQGVIDAIDALVVVASPDCTLRIWNRLCDATSGVALSEVAGKSLWTVMRLRPNMRSVAQAAFDRLISGSDPSAEFVSQWLRKDGRRARISWTARMLVTPDGREFVIATGSEATRGRKVVRDMAESEARFEKLLELLPDPVVVHQNGMLVFANRAAMELYGAATFEEFAERPMMDRVAPESRAFIAERVARMLTLGVAEPLAVETHLKMDGTPFQVEVIAAPVTFNGRPAVEVIVRDMTARNEAAAALQTSEAWVRAVFEQSALGMVLVDTGGRPVEANPAFERLLGYEASELRRMTVSDFTHPVDIEPSLRQIAELFGGLNDGFGMEKRYISKGGRQIWARVHVSPVREGPGAPLLAVATVEDITKHQALEEQLRQASKMEALGRLAGGVAHDFRNLLTVVNGYAELLATSLEGDERAADALEIRRAGARATELTAQLLAFGRRSDRAVEPIDINSRIEALVPMLRRLLGEDIELMVDLDRSLGAVEADPSQLDQVVMNLAVNGRDAMPSGGTLTLTTCNAGSDGPFGVLPATGWARLELADSGFGMAPEVLEHIFEPFFTTKSLGQGTGLGLATVYGIVQQMAGQIRVESAIGVGSRFIIDLPLCEAPVAPASPSVGGADSVHRASETVLLVEDEPSVREFCKRALTAEGYEVYAAGPHDALEIADRLGTKLDILVTDVVMPDLDGPTIAAALRSRRRDLKVMFMSGYPRDREDDLTGAAAEGMILAKPFSPRELCDAVRRVLARPVKPN